MNTLISINKFKGKNTGMVKIKTKTKDCQLTVKAKLSYGQKIKADELDLYARKCIRGLLKIKQVKKNTVEYIGPVGISLYEYFKIPVSKYNFFFIIEQVVDIVQNINANALLIDCLLIDLHDIFINVTTKEIQFIYLPLEGMRKPINILNFIESIIYSVIPMQEQETDYISKFVYFIKGLKFFDADKIEMYILQEDISVVNTIKKHNVNQINFMPNKSHDCYTYHEKTKDEATSLLDDEGATGILFDNESTGLLYDSELTGILDGNSPINHPMLHRVTTNEMISINKSVFRIGKEKNGVDYSICNAAVSRNHVEIIIRGNRYFIMDLDSKNGTYINDQALKVWEEKEIFNGDYLTLANEKFIFYT